MKRLFKTISLIFRTLFVFSRSLFLVVGRFLNQHRLTFISIAHSIILLFVSYAWLNLPFDYDSGEEHLTLFSFVQEQFGKDISNERADSIVFINIAYDKVLVPVDDALGLPAGREIITDREKLSRLLMVLSEKNLQKLVFLDIDFDKEYPNDSSLASNMVKTANLIIPHTSNSSIINKEIMMGAVSSRKTLLSGDFFKYPYLFDGEASIPVMIFDILDGGNFEKKCCWYVRNRKLAFNAIVPNYYYTKIPKYTAEYENNYYDLGEDFLSMEQEDIEQKIAGKIVLLGDLSEYDQHNTFMGEIPGILIVLNAYLNLKEGNNAISFWLILFLFLVYYILTINTLEDRSLINTSRLREWLSNFKVFGFILKVVSFAGTFWILSIAIKLIFGIYLNILLIGIYFVLLGSCIQFARRLKKK